MGTFRAVRIDKSEGGQQTAPMGRAVIGGLALVTLATLLVLPGVFASVRGGASRRAPQSRWLFQGRFPGVHKSITRQSYFGSVWEPIALTCLLISFLPWAWS